MVSSPTINDFLVEGSQDKDEPSMHPQNNNENSDHSAHNMDQESDHLDEERDHIPALEPGAAGRKMQQLAIEIYESTPKIVERKSP